MLHSVESSPSPSSRQGSCSTACTFLKFHSHVALLSFDIEQARLLLYYMQLLEVP